MSELHHVSFACYCALAWVELAHRSLPACQEYKIPEEQMDRGVLGGQSGQTDE